MRSQRLFFLFCLALSIAVHAALFETARRYGFGSGGSGPIAKRPKDPVAELSVLPPDAPEPPKPRDVFGEKGGVGPSINSSEGEQPQAAPLIAPDQAALSRDPTGNGPLTMAAPPQPLSQPLTAPPPLALPTPPLSKAPAFQKPIKPTPNVPPTPDQKPPEQAPKEPAEKPAEQPAKPAEPTPRQQPSPPADTVVARNGGRPIPQSDRDSDAFASQPAAEFRRGKVVARDGRNFKFTAPRGNVATMVEAAEISFPARLVFHVTIDASGNVRRAVVAKSSGSPSIDRAFLLSCYDSWFEPRKDANGQPIDQEFDFPITLR